MQMIQTRYARMCLSSPFSCGTHLVSHSLHKNELLGHLPDAHFLQRMSRRQPTQSRQEGVHRQVGQFEQRTTKHYCVHIPEHTAGAWYSSSATFAATVLSASLGLPSALWTPWAARSQFHATKSCNHGMYNACQKGSGQFSRHGAVQAAAFRYSSQHSLKHTFYLDMKSETFDVLCGIE
jgi:hypothetical protein